MPEPLPPHVAVFGALRSGTTLLRLMLDQHEKLACPGETDFLFDHVAGGAPGAPIFDTEAMSDNRIYRVFCTQSGLTPEAAQTLPNLLEAMQGQKAEQDATVILMLHRGLKTALTHLPGMKVLHLVRDPRDVARSSIGMGWAGSTYYGVQHWLRTEREWAAVAPHIAPKNVLQIKYETLIETPEETLTEICDFFGISFDTDMLAYDDASTYSKPDPSLIYQWRRKQTPREIALVEAQVGDFLQTLGYPVSGHPPLLPGPVVRMSLAVQQRHATWAIRIKRFGWRDPVIAMLSRRLRWPALGRSARRRMDKTVEQYLK